MRYQESKESSAEILRLALPHISRHGSGFQPSSYALWYEYVAGLNPGLKQALDARIATASLLTADDTQALCATHIAGRDMELLERLEKQLLHAVDEIGRAADHAGTDAKAYDRSLQRYGDELTPHVDIDTLRHIIQALASETKRMQQSNTLLSERLESSHRDFLELKHQLVTVQNEALIDPLTSLRNRRGFQLGVDEAKATRPAGLDGCALLMAGIDHSKKVNDAHGHLLGDKVLQILAQILRQCTKGLDVAARFGGEEFAILLPDTPPAGAVALAEQIRQTVAQGRIRRADRGEPIGAVTISLGVASYQAGESLEDWLARADRALYASKQHGRNRVTLASDELATV
jgi:diguanylate cyclase